MIILFLNIAKIPKKYSKKVYIINFSKNIALLGLAKIVISCVAALFLLFVLKLDRLLQI